HDVRQLRGDHRAHVAQAQRCKEASVNLASERVGLIYDAGVLAESDIIERIRHAGDDVPEQAIELAITGMTCANCAATVTRALKKVNGVLDASVNFANEHATVTVAPGTSREDLAAAVEKAGYGVVAAEAGEELADVEQAAREAEIRHQVRRLGIGALFTIPLFVLTMTRDFGLLGMWAH